MMLQAAYWFGCCTYYAFMVTTLVDYGWSDSAAAAAMTAMSVITIVTQPFMGYLCDRFISEKKMTILFLIAGAIIFVLSPFLLASGNVGLILINLAVITLTAVPVGGFLDAWIVGLKQEYPEINYGLLRGTGSLSYALSAQITGMLTLAFGHNLRFFIGSAAFIIAVLAALTFRPAKRNLKADSKENPLPQIKGLAAVKLLFSSKQYNLLLTVSFSLLICNYTMGTLIQLIIPDLGGTAAHIGTATAIMAGSEVPMMFLMALILKKIGFSKIFAFCSVIYVLRMFITASIDTVNGMIYIQALQGLSYAVLLPASMSYLSHILDERIRSTAVTTYAAVTVSLASFLGNLITSALLANGLSANFILLVFSFSALIGFSLTIFGVIRKIW